MDGKTLFGVGAALAVGLGLYFWYAGADKPPVPEFVDFQNMNLSDADKAKLFANIRTWFAGKGLDVTSPVDQNKISALLTPGQRLTIVALMGSGFTSQLSTIKSALQSLLSSGAPASP